jgi:uncharacterized protein
LGQVAQLPVAGVGLTYVPGLEPLIESAAGLLQILEVEPQTLWLRDDGSEERYSVDPHRLARLRSLPGLKVLHGVGFPVGGSRLPSAAQLPPLLETQTALDAAWVSEHLAFNRADGPDGPLQTGFLLPPRQTASGAACAVASIRSVARRLPVPFAVENGVSYLQPRRDELPDGAFLSAVVEAADCGIVLDLHNAWTNERNGRQSVREFLEQIPLERVWELHLAGGSEYNGYWLDAHAGAVPKDVLALARELVPWLPSLKAIVFEIMPASVPQLGQDGVRRELERLQELWALRGKPTTTTPVRSVPFAGKLFEVEPGPSEWEDVLGALVVRRPAAGPLAAVLAADPGVDVFRHLIGEFRGSTVMGLLPFSARFLLASLGAEAMERLLAEFWGQHPPEPFGTREARCFATFLERRELALPLLEPIRQLDLAVLDALTHGTSGSVMFDQDPRPVLMDLADRRLPRVGVLEPFAIDVTADGFTVRRLDSTRSDRARAIAAPAGTARG